MRSLLFIAWLLLVRDGKCSSPTPVGNRAPIEQFKQFIAHPPPIRDLVFAESFPQGNGASLVSSAAGATVLEYFQARLGGDKLLFRRLGRPPEARTSTLAGQLVLALNHRHWLVAYKPRFTTWDDREPSVAGKKLSIFYTVQTLLRPLRQILKMGIMHAPIGAVRWTGNRFALDTIDNGREHFHIWGTLKPNSQGLVDHLSVHYRMHKATADYMIRYGYSADRPYSFLPSTVTNLWLSGSNRTIIANWRILALEIAGKPLSARLFDIQPYRKRYKWPVRIFTNDAFYAREANGDMRYLSGFPAAKLAGGGGPSAIETRVLYVIWVMMNLFIFALAVRVQRPNKTMILTRKEQHEVQT